MRHIFAFLALIFIVSICNAEGNQEIESTLGEFSKAISEKDRDLFISLADSKGVYLVRKFTSGNLGGRGPELSKLTDAKKIDGKIQFPIKNQISYSVRIQFQELPIESFSLLPQRTLSSEVDTTHFDQWESILKSSLKDAPEVKDGDSLLLVSSRYWVYTEAQIIDDILVGGFAVFSMVEGKLKLVALIELL